MPTKKEEPEVVPLIGEIPQLPTLEEAKARQQALMNELNWLGGLIAGLEASKNGQAHSSPT